MFFLAVPLAQLVASAVVTTYVGNKIYNHTPIRSFQKSFVDNVFRDKVNPKIGSIVHCSLMGAEHTGVYVGNNKIVELLGSGDVVSSSPYDFVSGTNAISIYVACHQKEPLHLQSIGARAEAKIGSTREYKLVSDNCHQFTVGCITDEFENSSNFFINVEKKIRDYMNSGRGITWRVWDIDDLHAPDAWS